MVEEEPLYDRVWTIAVAGGAARRATEAAAHVWELAWLPDGAGLALVVADEPTASAWYRCRLARLDLASGDLATLYAPPAGRQVARPAPSPDGALVAVVACSWSDPGMSGGDLWVVPAAGDATRPARNLTAGVPFSVTSAAWLPDGRTLLYDAFDDNQTSVGLVRLDAEPGRPGWRRLWRAACGFGHTPAERRRRGRGGPRQRRGPAGGRARRPARTGRRLAGPAGGRRAHLAAADRPARRGPDALSADFEEVRWTAADGLAIGGLLLRPAGADGPVPLVVIVHGGPTAMAGPRFATRGLAALAPLLAARGIATLLPNYRGSNGRGVAYAEANHGDLGGADLADILAGVDHLVAAGVADPARLGLGGWSYGSFLTMWAVTQTDRFAAAVAGAGIADWVAFHGASILHAWDRLFFEADPYDPGGIYAARSPVRAIDAARTPTLVLHGEADRDVPADQGRAFFRALKERGVETRLVLYPGAAHGPREPRHLRDVIERSAGLVRRPAGLSRRLAHWRRDAADGPPVAPGAHRGAVAPDSPRRRAVHAPRPAARPSTPVLQPAIGRRRWSRPSVAPCCHRGAAVAMRVARRRVRPVRQIALYPRLAPDVLAIAERLRPEGFTLEVADPAAGDAGLAAVIGRAAFLVGFVGPLPDAVWAAAGRLRLIQLLSAGYDRVEIDRARERRLPIALNGGANAIAVAEHTVLLMLAVLRRLTQLDAGVRRGEWRAATRGDVRSHELGGRTVGLLGMGQIGREVARRLAGFGVDLRYHDLRRLPADEEARLGATYLPLDDAAGDGRHRSASTCRCCRRRAASIGAAALAAMRPGAVLINTARGELVDEAALAAALRSGRLLGAGLDVLAEEPPPADHPLLGLDTVVLTPHTAGPTWESWPRRFANAFANVERVARGEPPQWVIPELRDLLDA